MSGLGNEKNSLNDLADKIVKAFESNMASPALSSIDNSNYLKYDNDNELQRHTIGKENGQNINGKNERQGMDGRGTPNSIDNGLGRRYDNKVVRDNADIRRSGLSEEEIKNINESMIKKSTHKVGFFDKRIIEMLGPNELASNDPNYSKGFFAYINPKFFKNITPLRPNGYNVFMDDNGKYKEGFSLKKFSKSKYMVLFGKVEGNRFIITQHEGRGRMEALAKLGYTNVPVILYDETNNYGKQKYDALLLSAQEGTEEPKYVYAYSVIPASQKYKEEILKEYGEANDADYRYSKDLQVDNQGDKIPPKMSEYLKDSIGDRVNPYDVESPHSKWYHGSLNAIFTEFNTVEGNNQILGRIGTLEGDGYQGTSAIYLTNSKRAAASYSGKEEVVDPNKLSKRVKTLKQAKDFLDSKEIPYFKYNGDYYIELNDNAQELFIRNPYDMDAYYEALDEADQFIKDEEGKYYDAYDEVEDEEVSALDIGDIESLIETINNYTYK